MRKRIYLLLALCFLFFTSLSAALLAGQNNRLRREEERLFQSREELALAENRIRKDSERNLDLMEEVRSLSSDDSPRVMLTFDDGPSAITEDLLDILKDKNVRALFFINGVNVTSSREELLRRAVGEGHIIGNHTYSHDYSVIYRSGESFMEDFNRNEELIWKVTGTRSMFVRFPGGSRNSLCSEEEGALLMADLKDRITRRGYIYMDWNVTDNSHDADELIGSLERQILWKHSSTVLLHDRGDREVLLEALPRLIDELREKGFVFELYDPSSGVVRF